MRNLKKSSLLKTESVFSLSSTTSWRLDMTNRNETVSAVTPFLFGQKASEACSQKKNGRDKTKVMDEQLVLIDYLLEHVLELCLEPSKDISTSSG